MFRTQIALEEELRTCIPTVFQRNSMTILLNAVRVRRNNNHSVLCLKPCILVYMLVYTSIYVQYECIYSYLGIEAMKTSLWHVERVTSGTHCPSEQLGLPLHTAKSCQFTCHNMVMQDAVQLGWSPAGAELRSLISFIWKTQLLLHVLPNPLSQLCRQPAQGRVGCPVNILQPFGLSSSIWQRQKGCSIPDKLEFAWFEKVDIQLNITSCPATVSLPTTQKSVQKVI